MTVNAKRAPRPRALALFFLGAFLGLALWLGGLACSRGQDELVVQVLSLPDSNQSGTATLMAQGDKTEVVISISPSAPDGERQPAHIHYGTCGPRLGQVHIALQDVVEGASTTVVDLRLEALRDGNNAINIHKSYPEIQIYTACGDIPAR